MELENFVTSGGQLFATKDEGPIAELSIMQPHRSWKAANMT